jgi:hypothetical protein
MNPEHPVPPEESNEEYEGHLAAMYERVGRLLLTIKHLPPTFPNRAAIRDHAKGILALLPRPNDELFFVGIDDLHPDNFDDV